MNIDENNKTNDPSSDMTSESKNETSSSGTPFKDYYQRKKREMGDRTEKKLNGMKVSDRKKWFFVVFGLLFVLLVVNFVRSFSFGKKEPSVSLPEMVRDSVIDWTKVDPNDLSVMDLDTLNNGNNLPDTTSGLYFK